MRVADAPVPGVASAANINPSLFPTIGRVTNSMPLSGGSRRKIKQKMLDAYMQGEETAATDYTNGWLKEVMDNATLVEPGLCKANLS
ncbi:hypothetical protein [Paludibaculum fermentans]|uniref:hypothetical protein n=1 Tax=Paludibaculum fermentans TaxID=1473598 RepID=UPI003EBB23CA